MGSSHIAQGDQLGAVLCDQLEGWDREGGEGGRRKREEIWGYMYMYN